MDLQEVELKYDLRHFTELPDLAPLVRERVEIQVSIKKDTRCQESVIERLSAWKEASLLIFRSRD